ncbi:hypothetical protein DFH08DRAFT_968444 [Mycena albidolilacea]|uniref:Uncharacterized protein n=1 Tax=Mycena albidolilacea TaxID=1033008 RepID=A0AAD6ZJ34_9AGAR|nr:hypothetical protein DFH08DRAFT_968444 [Mycena albidolilacea]
MAPVCGLLCPLTLFPVGRHAPLILRNDVFTNESAMEQDIGKISGLAQTLQRCVHIVSTSSPTDRSSPDPIPIRCTVPRTSTLSTATALPKALQGDPARVTTFNLGVCEIVRFCTDSSI